MEEYPIRNTSKEYTEEYISLREATKYCLYSQGYLKLRARQGKLKAVKFGRNWVTKKEWVEEYLEKKNNRNVGVEPQRPDLSIEKPVPKLRFAFVMALVFVLLTAGIALGKESLKNGLSDIEDFASRVGERTDLVAAEIFNSTKNFVSLAGEGTKIVISGVEPHLSKVGEIFDNFVSGLREVTETTGKGFENLKIMVAEARQSQVEIGKEFFSWLRESIISIPKKIVQGLEKGYNNVYNFTKQKLSELAGIFKPTKEAVIVIPSTEKDEELKKKIEKAFSDEVKVEPKDETSGIIIPVFREREGEKYLYILVPVQN